MLARIMPIDVDSRSRLCTGNEKPALMHLIARKFDIVVII
jgi:hypothetical protein